MKPYVLFYSQACAKSNEIFEIHTTNPIMNAIQPFCIDGLQMLPKYIEYTPTLRIAEQGGYRFLVGDQILQWIDAMMKQNNQMANDFEQDTTITSMDNAFSGVPDSNPQKVLDDHYRITSGYNGTSPQSKVETKMNNFDMEERMREIQSQMKDLNPKYQQQTVELSQENTQTNELDTLFQNTSGNRHVL